MWMWYIKLIFAQLQKCKTLTLKLTTENNLITSDENSIKKCK